MRLYLMKLNVTWSSSETKGWKRDNEPIGVVKKLEFFNIDISAKGLLETFTPDVKELATVFIHWSYRRDESNKDLEAVQKIDGKAQEVYAYCLNRMEANRDLFISSWNIQRDRLYKSFTGIPFRPAASGEKLFTKVTEAGMTPKRFAEKINKDYGNMFRELKGQTRLTMKQAMDYSKALDCDPAELLFEDLRCKIWGSVDVYNSHPLGNESFDPCQIIPSGRDEETVVPRNIYTPNIRAVRITSKGSHFDRQIAFYKKSDRSDTLFDQRLVVVGKNEPTLEDYGYEPYSYWFGIYEVKRGGKEMLYNPDPFAEKKELVQGPFEFVAPIIATLHPSAIKRDYDYYEMNRRALDYFKIQEKQHSIMKDKINKMTAELQKQKDATEKLFIKDVERSIKEQQKKLEEELKMMQQNIKDTA